MSSTLPGAFATAVALTTAGFMATQRAPSRPSDQTSTTVEPVRTEAGDRPEPASLTLARQSTSVSGDAAIRDAQVESPQETGAPLTAEDVLRRLREQRPTNVTIAPAGEGRAGDGPGGTGVAAPLLPEGSAIVTRPGRLVYDGQWWTFVFESDHPDRPEPPIKLLPNRNLEVMVRAVETRAQGLVFVVSGEVTVFQGENYLLTTVAMRRANVGNLQK